jgi:hypothetical protein
MNRKFLCLALFALLLGCNHAPSSKQESAGQTPAAQPQPSNQVPSGQPLASPGVSPSDAEPFSAPKPKTRHAIRLHAKASPQQDPAASETEGSAPSGNVDELRSGPPAEQQLYPEPKPRLVVPAGSVIRVRLAETVDTKRFHAGDRFTATLDAPIVIHDRVAIPKGTRFGGHITEAKASGRLRGRGVLGLELDSFRLNGAEYLIRTGEDVRTSNSHKKRNWALIGGGTGLGAAIGAIAGHGAGAAIGAGAGAAAGTTTALITGKRNVKLPVETPLQFSLRSNVDLGV